MCEGGCGREALDDFCIYCQAAVPYRLWARWAVARHQVARFPDVGDRDAENRYSAEQDAHDDMKRAMGMVA